MRRFSRMRSMSLRTSSFLMSSSSFSSERVGGLVGGRKESGSFCTGAFLGDFLGDFLHLRLLEALATGSVLPVLGLNLGLAKSPLNKSSSSSSNARCFGLPSSWDWFPDFLALGVSGGVPVPSCDPSSASRTWPSSEASSKSSFLGLHVREFRGILAELVLASGSAKARILAPQLLEQFFFFVTVHISSDTSCACSVTNHVNADTSRHVVIYVRYKWCHTYM